MEHFRRLGIADELRVGGPAAAIARAFAYVTRFCGHEFGRLPRPIPIGRRRKSPTTSRRCVLERVLARCAERAAARKSISAGGSVRSPSETTTSLPTSRTCKPASARHITSRYLLGIDGASSTVRRALGFAMIGEDGSTQRAFMGGTMLSFFIRSPTLMAASKRPPTNMTWILTPRCGA
jgi:2-polyprenyl-6-methoxyphenol hydroxylase-like FAD-dependent oxidoreductase